VQVLLPGAAGRVLEGLVTNFFAIDADGALLTAVRAPLR
jgi:branched-subunit amino acid aminotransferase/4-amino-4-deoxychorismate lyase